MEAVDTNIDKRRQRDATKRYYAIVKLFMVDSRWLQNYFACPFVCRYLPLSLLSHFPSFSFYKNKELLKSTKTLLFTTIESTVFLLTKKKREKFNKNMIFFYLNFIKFSCCFLFGRNNYANENI